MATESSRFSKPTAKSCGGRRHQEETLTRRFACPKPRTEQRSSGSPDGRRKRSRRTPSRRTSISGRRRRRRGALLLLGIRLGRAWQGRGPAPRHGRRPRSTARSCRCGRPGAALDSAGEQRRRRLAHLEQRSVSGGRKWIWIGSHSRNEIA
jgi:hypothetical protein